MNFLIILLIWFVLQYNLDCWIEKIQKRENYGNRY